MYISGLADSKLELRCGGLRSFPGRGGYEFAFQVFESSNEGRRKKGRRRKMFYGEMWGNAV